MNREIVLFCCFFRFTKKEKVIQNTFGEQAARYTMTLLTREDNLKEQDIINKHPDLSATRSVTLSVNVREDIVFLTRETKTAL